MKRLVNFLHFKKYTCIILSIVVVTIVYYNSQISNDILKQKNDQAKTNIETYKPLINKIESENKIDYVKQGIDNSKPILTDSLDIQNKESEKTQNELSENNLNKIPNVSIKIENLQTRTDTIHKIQNQDIAPPQPQSNAKPNEGATSIKDAVDDIEAEYRESLINYLSKWKTSLASGKSPLQTYADLLDDTYALIVKEHEYAPLKVTERPVPLSATLDCANPKYSSFLTSEKRTNKVQIIDLIIFAYEFTVLEIRLYELYDVVDEFLILESNLTFKKAYKPLFFYQNRDKFAKFLDKITLITPYNLTRFNKDGSIKQLINVEQADIIDEYKTNVRIPKEMLENNEKEFFKIDYIFEYKYREILFSLYSKYIRKFDEFNDILIHGDLDEIPASNIVNHFKYCQVKDNLYPFSTWSTFFIYRFKYLFRSDFPASDDQYSLTFPNLFRLADRKRLNKIRFVNGFLLPRASGVHLNRFYGFVTDVYKAMSISDCTGLNDQHIAIMKNASREVYDEMKQLFYNGKFNAHYNSRIITTEVSKSDDTKFIPWVILENKEIYRNYI